MFPAILMLPVLASLLVFVALIATDPFAAEARR